MEQELVRLRQELEQAQTRAREEQRRREEAEASAEHSKPKTLLEYFKACHRYFHAPTVVTDESSTTQGNTTDPTGRKYPQRIIPWHNFITEQDEI